MKKWIRRILILASVLAAMKCIFVSLQMDEEYALSMSYRLVQGDRLLQELWDPHQTSGFLIQGLLWLWMSVFHTTTYSVIFVRAAGVLMQLGVSILVYREAVRHLDREVSFYLALIYFNLLPKGYVMPEFSNMLAWSLTILLLELIRHMRLEQEMADTSRLVRSGIRIGLWLSLLVLSYPSGAILYVFLLVYFIRYDLRKKLSILTVTVTSAICGSAYIGALLTYMTPAQLLANVQSLIASAGAHQKTLLGTLKIYGYDLIFLVLFLALYLGCAAIVYLILKKVRARKALKDSSATAAQAADAMSAQAEEASRSTLFPEISGETKGWEFLCIAIIMSFVLMVVHWIAGLWQYEYSYPYTVYYFILIGGILATRYYAKRKIAGSDTAASVRGSVGSDNASSAAQADARDSFSQAGFLIIGSNIVIFVAVMMLTNLTTFTTIKYLLSGVIGAMALILLYLKDAQTELYRRYAVVMLMVWCGAAAFVKGWAYPDNDGLLKNITVVGNVIDEGPAKGTFVEYMQGYITESTYEEFHTYLEPGDNLFVMDSNTLCVMYVDGVRVANSTTICSPYFDENLLDYWERNPDRFPDVIAVQCWYGELKYEPDSWMMQWIENEFGATQVVDGKFFRYYMKK